MKSDFLFSCTSFRECLHCIVWYFIACSVAVIALFMTYGQNSLCMQGMVYDQYTCLIKLPGVIYGLHGLKNGGSIDFVGGDCGCDFSLLAK